MNYSEIRELALSYADRTDAEVVNRIPNFIKIIESKLNRLLKISEISKRSVTATVEGQEYYSLPVDFDGLRDIELKDNVDSVSKITLEYATPERSNRLSGEKGKVYYTIVADQIQIIPRQPSGKILEVIYYKRLTPLTETEQQNEITRQYPDLYVFGLLVEINAFVKDKEASDIWNIRFNEVIDQISYNDSVNRWSAPFLQMTTG